MIKHAPPEFVESEAKKRPRVYAGRAFARFQWNGGWGIWEQVSDQAPAKPGDVMATRLDAGQFACPRQLSHMKRAHNLATAAAMKVLRANSVITYTDHAAMQQAINAALAALERRQ